MNYSKTVTKSTEYRENNDCSVKAVAISCDVSYTVARRALALFGRASRQGTTLTVIKQAIKYLGYHLELVQHTARTVKTLPSDRQLDNGYYVALVSGHILAMVNNKVEDWTEGRRHKVQLVLKVTPQITRKDRKAVIKYLLGA